MSRWVNMIVESALLAGGGAALGWWLKHWRDRRRRATVAEERATVLAESRREAEQHLREARLAASEASLQLRQQTEQQLDAGRKEFARTEQRLAERETLINRQLEGLVQQEATLRQHFLEVQHREKSLAVEREELQQLLQQRRDELKRLTHLSEAEARKLFMSEIERECLRDAADLTRHVLEEARTNADAQARKIIGTAIQRYAGEHSFENTTAIVALQGDDIKGRIIGREGRNIRAFEAVTGVTVLIDDTPNAVVLSAFDPVRREIAREAMERLILDGRIHPTRIEEVVAKVSQEMDEHIRRAGEEAVAKVGLPPLHPEIVRQLGRLHFRHSFAQNILSHSTEVAHLCGLMAAELGVDIAAAKRCGLLHDIGKALDHDIEGPHALVGADWIRRFGEPEEIVNGVAAHHGETPATNLFSTLVSAADAISASRPGARSETLTTYINRLESLEKIGLSFTGVEKCYAVQAGRELRILVRPEVISDEAALALARNIARRIENDLQYPGQIRVTVIRETRNVEFAK